MNMISMDWASTIEVVLDSFTNQDRSMTSNPSNAVVSAVIIVNHQINNILIGIDSPINIMIKSLFNLMNLTSSILIWTVCSFYGF